MKMLAIGLVSTIILATGPVWAAGSCQDQIVPAYSYPSAGGAYAPWNQLFGKTGADYNSPLARGLTRYIIMSPNSAAGAGRDANWVDVIVRSHDPSFSPPGTEALASIDLAYGKKTATVVKAAIDSLVRNYFATGKDAKLYFDGIFFDQAPSDSNHLAYMRDILSYASASTRFGPDADFWMNFGYWPSDETYMNLASQAFTGAIIENLYFIWSIDDILGKPNWVSHYEPSRFASIVTSASAPDMLRATIAANSINNGVAFVTDGSGRNPFSTLPTYWSSELTQMNGGCSNDNSHFAKHRHVSELNVLRPTN